MIRWLLFYVFDAIPMSDHLKSCAEMDESWGNQVNLNKDIANSYIQSAIEYVELNQALTTDNEKGHKALTALIKERDDLQRMLKIADKNLSIQRQTIHDLTKSVLRLRKGFKQVQWQTSQLEGV